MFSVVIPAFNAGSSLRRAVESVLRQQGPPIELIVVDDGSTDDGMDSIACLDDPRLGILRQPNLGGGAARNTGIEAASHPWVALLDADDIWLPGHLEELGRIRDAHPDAGLIGTPVATVPAGATSVRVPRREAVIRRINFLRAVANDEPVLTASSAAVRKQAWEAVGRGGTMAEGPDRETWVRLALAWPVAMSSRVTAVYARAAGSDTQRIHNRRRGRPFTSCAELSSSVATLLDRYQGADAALRADIDAYIMRYIDYRLREAAAARDIVVMRSIARLYRAPPPREHRALLAITRLPAPAAALACRLGFAVKAAARRLRPRRDEPHDIVRLPR